MNALRIAAALVIALCGPVTSAQQPKPLAESDTVLVITSGPDVSGLYHARSCPVVKAGGTVSVLTVKEADTRYFRPHCLCVTGHDEAPPCETAPSSAARTVTSPTSATEPATPKSSLVGMTEAQVRTALGLPSLTQSDVWYYSTANEALRVYFKNGKVTGTNPSDVAVANIATPAASQVKPPAPAPVKSSAPTPTARCKDGTYSYSQNRSGTCSGHGGVAQWLR